MKKLITTLRTITHISVGLASVLLSQSLAAHIGWSASTALMLCIFSLNFTLWGYGLSLELLERDLHYQSQFAKVPEQTQPDQLARAVQYVGETAPPKTK